MRTPYFVVRTLYFAMKLTYFFNKSHQNINVYYCFNATYLQYKYKKFALLCILVFFSL